eukprot:SAG22_NODE_2128_length_2969_cov_46.413937_2_plen_48_part_00
MMSLEIIWFHPWSCHGSACAATLVVMTAMNSLPRVFGWLPDTLIHII